MAHRERSGKRIAEIGDQSLRKQKVEKLIAERIGGEDNHENTKKMSLTCPDGAGPEPQRLKRKDVPSRKPRSAGLPVRKHWEMGWTIQRIEKSAFCYSLNWLYPITFERGSLTSPILLSISLPALLNSLRPYVLHLCSAEF